MELKILGMQLELMLDHIIDLNYTTITNYDKKM